MKPYTQATTVVVSIVLSKTKKNEKVIHTFSFFLDGKGMMKERT